MLNNQNRLGLACLVSSLAALASPALAQFTGVFPSTGEIRVQSEPVIENTAFIDLWGTPGAPYVAQPGRPSPRVVVRAPMPSLALPANLGTMRTEVRYKGNATSVLSGTVNCRRFILQTNHVLQIQGDVVIYAADSFTVENHSRIELLDGASLTVYFAKVCALQNNTDINMNTWDPKRVTFVNLGTGELSVRNSVRLCASIACSRGSMNIQNNSDVFGWYVGKDLSLSNSGALHVPGTARKIKFASGSSMAD